MRNKTRLESADYRTWQNEVSMIHDLFSNGWTAKEIRQQYGYVVDDIKSFIWDFIGEDYWNQP